MDRGSLGPSRVEPGGHSAGVGRGLPVGHVCDPACAPEEIVALYHQRWEIETAYFELKSTIVGGAVLRARTPTG